MEQERAFQVSDLLARNWGEWNGGETQQELQENYESVRAGAFSELMDFISDLAVLAVVQRKDESPMLLALDGDHLYTITVVKPGQERETAEIENVMRFLDPRTAEVTCRKSFIGSRTGPRTIPRRTSWRFKLGDFTLEFEADPFGEPPFETISTPDGLALVMADQLGWKQLP